MHLPDPTFPPLLTGYPVASPKRPWDVALGVLERGNSVAGDIYWAKNVDRMEFAIIFEPDVEAERCPEMLYLGMVAFSDALGALSPPEVAVTFLWPNIILVNGAIVGRAKLEIGSRLEDQIPGRMAFGLSVYIRPPQGNVEPGEALAITCLHLEGCGDLDRTGLIESTARHMVNWIYTWEEEGFKPIHQEWTGRYHDEAKMGGLHSTVKSQEKLPGSWVMMDELGNAIVKNVDGTNGLIKTMEGFDQDGG